MNHCCECGAEVDVEAPAEHPWMADCLLCWDCAQRELGVAQ